LDLVLVENLPKTPTKSIPQNNSLKNTPKIACQALNPLNPFLINNIPMAKNPSQTAIIKIGGNSPNLAEKESRATVKSFACKYLDVTPLSGIFYRRGYPASH
jgi:hypothetical protein